MSDQTPPPGDPAVRVLDPRDAATLAAAAQLLHDFNVEYDDVTPGPAALAARISELVLSAETVVLVVDGPGGTDAGPLGLAVLRFRPALWTAGLDCYLAELYVVPAQRGHGLGRRLMLAAIDLARARGADSIELGTGDDDVAARRLYESLGFRHREGGPDGPVNYVYTLEL